MLDIAPSDAATAVRPAPRPRPFTLACNAAVIGWTAFSAMNLVVSGRWSIWLVFSLVPPAAFLVVPLVATALLGLRRGGHRRVVLGVALLGVLVGVPQSGLELGAVLSARQDPVRDTVRVVSWNTEYWHQGDDPAAFFGFLRDLDADVYLLQEYIYFVDGDVIAIDDLAGIRAAFPGYSVSVKAQQVTLSRLAVLGEPAVADENVLRVDVGTRKGTALSTYNVHIPAQLDPTRSPLSPSFYRTMVERGTQRRAAYDALTGSARRDANPAVIAGDFNTSPAMGDIRAVEAIADDAAGAGHSAYPVTWNEHQWLPMWRLDWAFVRPGATVRDYRLLPSVGLSDHRAQVIDVETAGTG